MSPARECLREPLGYHDPAEDFSFFASRQGSVFLDSSLLHPSEGRYSLWGTDPSAVFQSESGFVTMDGSRRIGSPADSLRQFYAPVEILPADPYLPFQPGLIGFLSYEWGLQLENIAPHPKNEFALPDGWFGFYDTILLYDHAEKTCSLLSVAGKDSPKWKRLKREIEKNRGTPPPRPLPQGEGGNIFLPPPLRGRVGVGGKADMPALSLTPEDYRQAFAKIQNYLRRGDCYQINLTRRFSARLFGTPWALYENLRAVSPAPYAAFLNLGDIQILSSSPELFLKSDPDRTLTTRPIKGTRPRGQTAEEDRRRREELARSPKDRAELLMITDLERNDLGKVSEPGSVTVEELQTSESYAQVHHLHSTIRARRQKSSDLVEVLKALSPGGSITGCPKIRAMEIIRELEPVRRGVYTGSIGWMGPGNRGHFNIAIRTMTVRGDTVHFNAGGGIVIDSDVNAEYEELMTKSEGMREALGL